MPADILVERKDLVCPHGMKVDLLLAQLESGHNLKNTDTIKCYICSDYSRRNYRADAVMPGLNRNFLRDVSIVAKFLCCISEL